MQQQKIRVTRLGVLWNYQVATHVNIHIQANYVCRPKSHLMSVVRHPYSNPFIYSMLRRTLGLWCEVLIEVFPVISVLVGFCGYCCSGD
jgi:hypothetical protein